MNEIVINQTTLTAREYNGQRVLTFRDIDTVHQRPDGTAGRNFRENRKYFIEGVDYFQRNSSEAKEEFNIIAPNGLMLITETGYLMIVKSFTDDLAWTVQRQLVNAYFRHREQAEATANDKIKVATALLDLAKSDELTGVQKNLLLSEISAILTDEHKPTQIDTNIHKLPFYYERQKALKEVYFATDVAEIFGVTPHKIGRLATRLGMKTEEYGVMFTDISPYTGKKFAKFGYNEKAIEKFKEIFTDGNE